MSDKSDEFIKLAKSDIVRRAARNMANNRPPATDDRFAEMLRRLGHAEQKDD